MAEVSNLTINVSANADKATNNINALVASLQSLRGTIASVNPQLSSFATVTGSIKPKLTGVAKSTDTASKSLNKVKTETKNAGKEVGKSSHFFKSLKNVMDKLPLGRLRKGMSKLGSSFKRILMYRVLRSLIRAITQALKEGVNNLYQWSKAMDSAGYGQFAQTMDSLATSFLYLKNSLGAMVAPLIQSLAPAINWVIDRFVDLLNIVNQVFAFLSGQSSWTRAKRVPTEFGEAADKASGAAKELRDVLADFDEINLIDPGKNGGGGGGSSSSLNYEDMFETVGEFDAIVKKLQPLKDLMETIVPLFKQLGEWAVSTLLPNVLESVAFQVGNIATDVGTIVNGIIEKDPAMILNGIKNILVDIVTGPAEAMLTLWDSLFNTDYAELFRKGVDAMREFDIWGWLEGQKNKISIFLTVDVPSFFEAIFLTVKQRIEYLVDAAKGLWKGITTGDFDDYNAAAEKFNNVEFGLVLDEVRAKNLEIYNQAELAALRVDIMNGRYEALAKAAVLMPNSSAKKVVTTVEKGKRWAQVGYQVLTAKDGTRTIKANLAKGAKWQADAWKVIDKASAKEAAMSLDVNVNPKVKYKLNARDMINFKDQYIKIYGTSGSVGQMRIMANGGFLNAGDLFVAREAGPEMVGSMNGRTAVANNEQIVEGVASGVFRAIVNTGIVDAVKNNKKGSAPVFAPSVEAGRWIQRSLNMYQTVS